MLFFTNYSTDCELFNALFILAVVVVFVVVAVVVVFPRENNLYASEVIIL